MNELKKRIKRNAINNFNKNGAKFDSEITITRREEDIRKDNGGSKRTMPIAMYVVGEIKPKHLEIAKIFNAYYEKNNLGKFRIIKVNPSCYMKRGSNDVLQKKGDDIHGRGI